MSKRYPRGSGLLLHPTSLPGPYGIGDLGPAAHAWVDSLASAYQSWWQVLPLGPTGFGDSPYQSFSSFAGNVNLLSPELLVQDGLISAEMLEGRSFPDDFVDYPAVEKFKLDLSRRAWETFRDGKASHLKADFEAFVVEKQSWLEDYVLFMSLRDSRNGEPWYEWPVEFRHRGNNGDALAFARENLADSLGTHQFGQFMFFRQWNALRKHAGDRGIRLIGDVPIFVSPDSADIWANPQLFLLDETLRPSVVAGVPPDYFSKTGQLWGNPHYDWESLKQTGYAWWIDRIKATLDMVDIVRLDHFRGFAAAWQVKADEETAVNGRWVPGPGVDFFRALERSLGELPLIAEDLGEITPDVYVLRDTLGLPGMKILQFAFDSPENAFLPHHYDTPNCISYTGTHDNDTTRGWYEAAPDSVRDFLRRYVARVGTDVSWDLIRLVWSSVADLAIAPVQDVLDLGTESRMNMPGSAEGNWRWRMNEAGLGEFARSRLADLTEIYDRAPKVAKKP